MLQSALILVSTLAGPTSFDHQWLAAAFPDVQVTSVRAAAVEPWLEAVLGDGEVVYATPDGEYLLAGSLVDLRNRQNLTDLRRDEIRKDLIAEELPGDLFEFPAEDGDRWVTVVTDIDCPYCRRLHQRMAEYNDAGISIRYLMLPRSGLGTPSHDKAVWAACAVDPEAAITQAMNGEAIPAANCENTVDDQFVLSRKLRVTGTPAIVTDSGRMFPGYVPPNRLVAELAAD